MSLEKRVVKLEEEISPKKAVWLSRLSSETEAEKIAEYERNKGVSLKNAVIQWVEICISNVGEQKQ